MADITGLQATYATHEEALRFEVLGILSQTEEKVSIDDMIRLCFYNCKRMNFLIRRNGLCSVKASANMRRYTGERQGDELPLHRVLNLAILVGRTSQYEVL